MSEVLQITLTTNDNPELASVFSDLLAQQRVRLLDVHQTDIQGCQSLSFKVEVETGANDLIEILCTAAEDQQAGIFVQVESSAPTETLPAYVITLMARHIDATQLASMIALATTKGLTISQIKPLSDRLDASLDGADAALNTARAAIDIRVRGGVDNIEALRAELRQAGTVLGLDVALQVDTAQRFNRRLAVFDMDSTLIQAEVIDELAKEAGIGAQVAAITERAMQGELDFSQSLTQRVALLKGLDEGALERAYQRIELSEGCERLFATLNARGFHTAILSGGFTWFAEKLQQKLGINEVHANQLEIIDGTLSGKVVGDIVDAERKADILTCMAQREGIDSGQTIAIGDGANDLLMLKAAGLGVAFHAKPVVQQSAKQAITTLGLDGLLYLIGISDAEQRQLTAEE